MRVTASYSCEGLVAVTLSEPAAERDGGSARCERILCVE